MRSLTLIALAGLLLATAGCTHLQMRQNSKTGQLEMTQADFMGQKAHAALGLIEAVELCRNNDGTFSRCDIATHADPVSSDVRVSTGSVDQPYWGGYGQHGQVVSPAPSVYGTRVTQRPCSAFETSAACGGYEVHYVQEGASTTMPEATGDRNNMVTQDELKKVLKPLVRTIRKLAGERPEEE